MELHTVSGVRPPKEDSSVIDRVGISAMVVEKAVAVAN